MCQNPIQRRYYRFRLSEDLPMKFPPGVGLRELRTLSSFANHPVSRTHTYDP